MKANATSVFLAFVNTIEPDEANAEQSSRDKMTILDRMADCNTGSPQPMFEFVLEQGNSTGSWTFNDHNKKVGDHVIAHLNFNLER